MAILFPRLPFFNLSPPPAKECPSVSLLLLFGELPKQTGPLNLSFRTTPQGFGSAGSGTKSEFWGPKMMWLCSRSWLLWGVGTRAVRQAASGGEARYWQRAGKGACWACHLCAEEARRLH